MIFYVLPLLSVVFLDISSTQYTENTACGQAYFGRCSTQCNIYEEIHPNTYNYRLCNYQAQVCCTPVGRIGSWAPWSEWSACSVSCGQGTRRRNRTCGAGVCLGERSQVDTCQNDCSAAVDGWGAWGEWTTCSVTCGNGQRIRARQCLAQDLDGGCEGMFYETNTCNSEECPQVPPATSQKHCVPVVNRAVGTSNVSSCEDNPWTVHFDLYRNSPNMTVQIPFCYGVLLSNSAILTTRVCGTAIEAVSVPEFNVVAFAGSESEVQIRNISSIIFPVRGLGSNFDDNFNLTIVRVSDPYNLDTCAVPVCLPEVSDTFAADQQCRITGWEPISDDQVQNPVVTSVQREGNVTLVLIDTCRQLYSDQPLNNVTLYDDTICTFPLPSGNATTCDADHGWMLVCDDQDNVPTLVGLSSDSPCLPDRPSTFQGVQQHVDWIRSVLRDEI